jgi:pimeloyl-ACP methyl ester carboxylesterase
MDPGPRHRPPRRITGVAGLLGALRTFGMIGHGGAHDTRLQHFTADDGQAIPVRVLGDGAVGTPVVLVHGLGCSHHHWMAVAKRLRRHHRVFVWDARGHGQCRPHPGSVIGLARLALDLRQLLDHFGLARAVFVGHSMGALTVLQYLQDHGSARVAGVGLVDQSPRIVTDAAWRLGMFGACSAEMLLGLIAGARRDLAETVLHEVEAAAGGWLQRRLAPDAVLGRLLRRWLHQLDPSALLDLAESLAVADFRPLLPLLNVPMWVVLGGRSAHYGELPLAAYYRRAVPHAAVTVYARSGHSPHVAEPERFANELMRFVEDHR